MSGMTPQHPAAPETETDANGWVGALTEAHRDSHPMGNIHHGTPENPEWGTFCVECKESWPCDVSRLLERVRVVEGERECECPTDDYCPKCHPRWYAKWVKREIENLRHWKSEALPVIDGLQDLGHALGLPLGERITGPAAVEAARAVTARAESAEAAHEAEKAAHERLRAGIWALGESIHGDEGVEHVEGCEGEPTCFACILDTLRSLLGGGEAR